MRPNNCKTRYITLAILFHCYCFANFVSSQTLEEESLKEVLIELRALEERLSQQNLDHERSSRALREVEVKISESSKELVLIQQQLSDQQEHIRNLENEIDEVQLRLNGERAVLYQQVRQSYFSGRQEKIKLLLNQEEPARLGRMVIYYDFLNRARI